VDGKMATIWVIADTHLSRNQFLPEAFVRRVSREDIILHLGDIVSLEAFEQLRGLCHLEAVRGNCDMPDLRSNLPPKAILELNDLKIGMTHGKGGPSDTLRHVTTEFGGKVDIALFGHTHIPYHMRNNGTLYFNPGSLKSGRGCGNSFGILHLEEEPWGELIEL
jgi:putative phosphoesterase